MNGIDRSYPVTGTKEISVNYDGNMFLVIYGEHVNGGFFSIPNWECGGELSSWGNFSDVFWNTESIARSLKKKKAAKFIAEAIAAYEKQMSK